MRTGAQESFQQAIAEHELLMERRAEKLMAMLEKNGFHCERDPESAALVILIWPKQPLEVPPGGISAKDCMIDDVLANFLKQHPFF